MENHERKLVLIPFNAREALTVKQAAGIANRSAATIRAWCQTRHIGRRVPANGPWRVSAPCLQMFLDGNAEALTAYHRGERRSSLVASYFARAGITPPEDVEACEGFGEDVR